MAWDQYTHPEFGFLCPTPRLRRELRIALVASLFGAIAGAVGVVAHSASQHNTDPPTVAVVLPEKSPIAGTSSNAEPTSVAATDSPDVARLPLGPTTASSAFVEPNPSHGTAKELQGSAQESATTATLPSSEGGMQDRVHSSGAPAKKPQMTARGQNRQRGERGSGADRPDQWVGRVETVDIDNRGGRLGHINARDGSYARQGFWDWSR
jgi:hypothetical protein